MAHTHTSTSKLNMNLFDKIKAEILTTGWLPDEEYMYRIDDIGGYIPDDACADLHGRIVKLIKKELKMGCKGKKGKKGKGGK